MSNMDSIPTPAYIRHEQDRRDQLSAVANTADPMVFHHGQQAPVADDSWQPLGTPGLQAMHAEVLRQLDIDSRL